MPSFYVDEIDIEVGDFLDACSKREIKTLIEYLIEDGHINRESQPVINKHRNIHDDEWDEIINILRIKRLVMSEEDEKLIKEISKKY